MNSLFFLNVVCATWGLTSLHTATFGYMPGPFQVQYQDPTHTGISLNRNFLAHGIDRRVQGPKSLGPWGLQDNLPCCLSLISTCIGLTPLTRQALSTQGGSSCHWPNIPPPASSQLLTPEAEKATSPPPRGESHEKNPDWSRGHLEPITESRMCTRICP